MASTSCWCCTSQALPRGRGRHTRGAPWRSSRPGGTRSAARSPRLSARASGPGRRPGAARGRRRRTAGGAADDGRGGSDGRYAAAGGTACGGHGHGPVPAAAGPGTARRPRAAGSMTSARATWTVTQVGQAPGHDRRQRLAARGGPDDDADGHRAQVLRQPRAADHVGGRRGDEEQPGQDERGPAVIERPRPGGRRAATARPGPAGTGRGPARPGQHDDGGRRARRSGAPWCAGGRTACPSPRPARSRRG